MRGYASHNVPANALSKGVAKVRAAGAGRLRCNRVAGGRGSVVCGTREGADLWCGDWGLRKRRAVHRLGAPDPQRAAMQSVLILAGVMFVIGAALSAGAVNLSMVVLGRLVLGLGVGGGTTVRPHGRLFLVCLVCLLSYTLCSAGLCLSAHGSCPCEARERRSRPDCLWRTLPVVWRQGRGTGCLVERP